MTLSLTDVTASERNKNELSYCCL